MTDRELLEKAARAAGMKPGSWFDGWNDEGRETGLHWNPLTDDGDVFRLAVALGIDVTYKAFGEDEVMVSASDNQFDGWFTEHYGDDKAAATRRAIVRAAAEIADAAGAA